MTSMKCVLFVCALTFILSPLLARADEADLLRGEVQADRVQITQLTNRITKLESRTQDKDEDAAVLLFIVAVFCALWAQNTGRNAWLWFFLGALFNVMTLLVLLFKNAAGIRRARRTQIYEHAR